MFSEQGHFFHQCQQSHIEKSILAEKQRKFFTNNSSFNKPWMQHNFKTCGKQHNSLSRKEILLSVTVTLTTYMYCPNTELKVARSCPLSGGCSKSFWENVGEVDEAGRANNKVLSSQHVNCLYWIWVKWLVIFPNIHWLHLLWFMWLNQGFIWDNWILCTKIID